MLLGVAALVASTVARGQQPAASAPSSTYKPKPEPFPEGLLWRVARKGGKPSYVFGTIYVQDPALGELPPEVLAALKATRRFAQQLDLNAFADTRSFDLEVLRDGRSLPGIVGEADFVRLEPLLLERGVSAANIERLKPWAAWLALVRSYPRGPLPIQEALALAARKGGHKSLVLDYPRDQAAALDSIPAESQVALLVHAIESHAAYRSLADGLVKAWTARSLAGIADVYDQFSRRFPTVGADYRAMMRSLVDNRNVQMKHRLTVNLQQGGVFVALDAVHLPGARGLLAGLQRDGYTLEKTW